MNRRNFIAASAAVGAAATLGATAEAQSGPGREYYELREYKMQPGANKKALSNYLKDAEIPALKRLGAGPVGAFTGKFGGRSLSLFLLVTHKNLASVQKVSEQLAGDEAFQKAGAAVLDAPIGSPAYARIESSLMVAFKGMPHLKIWEKNPNRVFELRRYEGHSRKANKKKIEMFDVAEIEVFEKTGLQSVFFGETIIGPNLPNLTYMLHFPSMDQHQSMWSGFSKSKEWRELSGRAEFKNTVSNIANILLKPAPYSEI